LRAFNARALYRAGLTTIDLIAENKDFSFEDITDALRSKRSFGSNISYRVLRRKAMMIKQNAHEIQDEEMKNLEKEIQEIAKLQQPSLD